ncbi:MAG: hypothetical protein DRN66_01140 [Candidatus Nanohalarchaeota archaeon]|nr:MAG: hypothetical protein DRN66_01140 [Candidatus Nanohaloarchaeota archaeon]
MHSKTRNDMIIATAIALLLVSTAFAGPNIVNIFAEGETVVHAADMTGEIIIEVTADYYYSVEQDLDFTVLGNDS